MTQRGPARTPAHILAALLNIFTRDHLLSHSRGRVRHGLLLKLHFLLFVVDPLLVEERLVGCWWLLGCFLGSSAGLHLGEGRGGRCSLMWAWAQGGGWAVLYWCAMRGGIEDGFDGGVLIDMGLLSLAFYEPEAGF